MFILMKKEISGCALAFLLFLAASACGQVQSPSPNPEQDSAATDLVTPQAAAVQKAPLADSTVTVFQSVLKLADWAGVKYNEELTKAKTGNALAIKQLLEFHATADGVDALNHAVTCLELLAVVPDERFASAVQSCKPQLKQLLLERLILAQGRTKKEHLRKSMTDWAPITYAFLAGKEVPSAGNSQQQNDDSSVKPNVAPPSAMPPSTTQPGSGKKAGPTVTKKQ